MQVIVLGGIARVGKTEVADILELEALELGKNPLRISFSTPLKQACAEKHGYQDPRKFKEDMPDIYRKECQELGASARANDEDHWVNLWLKLVSAEQKKELQQPVIDSDWKETVIICDDCRYPNELAAVKQFGAITMFILKGKREVAESDAPWRAHESEWMAQKIEAGHPDYEDMFDWTLVNDKGIDELEEKLELRSPHLLGDSPARFTDVCTCAECKAFKCDIQAEELLEGLKTACQEIQKDDDMSDHIKNKLLEHFEDIIDQVENGDMSIQDLFGQEWWQMFKEEHDNDDKEEPEDDDDDNANDGLT